MATKLKEAPLPQLSRPMAVKRMRHKKGVSVAAGTGRSGRDGVHDGRADAGGKGKWNRQARHPEIAKPLGSADNSGGSLVQRHRLEVSQCPGCSNSVSWLRSWRRALLVGQNSRHFRTYGLKAQMLQTISTTRPSREELFQLVLHFPRPDCHGLCFSCCPPLWQPLHTMAAPTSQESLSPSLSPFGQLWVSMYVLEWQRLFRT